MIGIKHYNKEAFRKKFVRYRVMFFIALGVFFAFFLGETILFGSANFSGFAGEMPFGRFAARLFVKEAVLYLAVFLMGVTVYGPVLQFALPACRGVLAGFSFSAVVGEVERENVLSLVLLAALYTLFSSQLLFSYLSFCTCVSLHLFTDRSLLPYQNSEKHLFGGSLFYSGYFCNSINLRFLFTYSLLFFSALLLLGGLCVFYAFLRGLFF